MNEDLLVLLKVSKQCPLGCVYCYEGEKNDELMDDETLANTINMVESRQNPTKTTYIHHGAEPLTRGKAFYKKVRQLQRPFEEHHTVRNAMQTNGVLLTPELADFFVAEEFDLGFSLDGPRELHDQTRPFLNGMSSFDQTMSAIELMKERGKRPGVIAVLTKKSLGFLDDMYDFFKDNDLSFKLNPLLSCGSAIIHDDLYLTDDEKVWAITHLFDRWFFDETTGQRIDYDTAFSMVTAMLTGGGNSCNMSYSCQDSFLGISTDGTILPCSRFEGPEISYGNINQIQDISEALEHPLRRLLQQRYSQLPVCGDCEQKEVCYGGCIHNAYIDGDIMGRDPHCSSNKQIYEHMAKRVLEEMVRYDAIPEV